MGVVRAFVAGILLLAAIPCFAPPVVIPAPDPGRYPPGTIFAVTISPDGRFAWAPSQDPDLPPVTMADGRRVPVLDYTPGEFPKQLSPDFAVVRSGGHLTLAQLLFFEESTPERRDEIVSGRYRISRAELDGYTAVTVRFNRNPAGGWTPEIVSWKSLQLNAQTWKHAGGQPPDWLKRQMAAALDSRVNGLAGDLVRCRLLIARYQPRPPASPPPAAP